jgi:hypothetical protein
VDNSLQEFAGSFTFVGMKYKFKSAIASVALVTATLIPTTASASEVCVGATCTVTFEYTGASQSFIVPEGVSVLTFEVLGAAGARGGGGGGVTGTFAEVPESLLLYVGGAGNLGAGASGGFNGGGNAGSQRGNEGSGGGASDIRTGASLESRIIVAGGGGGGGGFSGALGASGGGVIAASGGSGQGGGGGGGGVSAGGSPGASNGGTNASWGAFGSGGSGGSSWLAGGGGGGGGWYGGGGGGADGDDCCSDGGGGGGGSSFANATLIQDPQHSAGVRVGHGRIRLSYTILPEVISFSGSQVSKELAEFHLEMSQEILGLTEEDFELIGTSCNITSLISSENTAIISVTGCLADQIELALMARSVGNEPFGPSARSSAILAFDQSGPSFSFGESANLISTSQLVIPFTHSDSVTALDIEMFEFLGCEFAELLLGAISLSGCVSGNQAVSFLGESLSDEFGNLGPAESLSFHFEIDQTNPEAFWSEVIVTGTGPFTISAVLSFSEQVAFDPQSVILVSDIFCPLLHQQIAEGWSYSATCGYGAGRFELAAESLIDQVGLLGPALTTMLEFSNPEPVVLAPPAPVIPQPAPPNQSSTEPPIASEPVLVPESVSPEVSVPIVEPGVTKSPVSSASESVGVPLIGAPGFLADAIDSALAKQPPITQVPDVPKPESLKDAVPVDQKTTESVTVLTGSPVAVIAQEVAGPQIALEPQSQTFWPWLLLGLGGFVILGGLGLWRFSGK